MSEYPPAEIVASLLATRILAGGHVCVNDRSVRYGDSGVRPALWLKMKSEAFYMYMSIDEA